MHDGAYHLPEFYGQLPPDVTVKYLFDGVESTDGVRTVGTHEATLVFSGNNYNELTLHVTFKIKMNFGSLATNVVDSFGSVPDFWEFLPESFAPENRLVSSATPIDYSTFVNISDIPTNGMGKQLNVVYGVLTKAESALSVVNVVYGSMNIVKNLYTEFLDSNPADYQYYEGNAGPFNFTLSLEETAYTMTASVGTVNVTITSSPEIGAYGARVQLTETTVLQYIVEDETFTIGLNILNTASTLIEFVREDDITLGYVYENITALGYDLVNTSALIHIGDDYTTLIGTKGDFIPTSDSRNCEIYSNETGELVGTKVRELVDISLTTVTFNTYWFPLYKLDGIETIKKLDELNGLNADSIYINGAAELLKSEKIGGFNLKRESRKYDIEFKTMYFYTYDEENEEYVSVEMEIPMFFVQEECLEDFEDDFSNANEDYLEGNVSLLVFVSDYAATEYAYTTLLTAYDLIKDLVSADDIKEFCGIPTEEAE